MPPHPTAQSGDQSPKCPSEEWTACLRYNPRVPNKEFSSCHTRANRTGMWLMNRGRFMNAKETLRAQGINDQRVIVESEGDLKALVGNSMSPPVVEKIVREIVSHLTD